ncbi:hypothetical protein [Nitrospirillum amazonense]|uniref:Uncharacterized protein n=1 Tax=Nitrospirillum amazonense TaxID=28077 RepID=A0A560JM16_9PROT|nr:hypothetical protein [Nitrospirillum amazonense]MDG3438857.1 hypothetical protein [Nitrospirillum amazonense]TWB69340.1 hypothetical protein FBZ87_109181 [Nitrospirillum amazonense]
MSSASDSPTDDGEIVSVDTSDPTVACLSIVSWSMAIAALGAIVLLALVLLLLNVSQYVFLMVWIIGAPFAAAVAALGVLFIQLNQRRQHG